MDRSYFTNKFNAHVDAVIASGRKRARGDTTAEDRRVLYGETKNRRILSERTADDWIDLIEGLGVSEDLTNHVACIVLWDYAEKMAPEDIQQFDRFIKARYRDEDPPEVVCLALHQIGYTPHEAYKRSKLPKEIHDRRYEHPEDAIARTNPQGQAG